MLLLESGRDSSSNFKVGELISPLSKAVRRGKESLDSTIIGSGHPLTALLADFCNTKSKALIRVKRNTRPLLELPSSKRTKVFRGEQGNSIYSSLQNIIKLNFDYRNIRTRPYGQLSPRARTNVLLQLLNLKVGVSKVRLKLTAAAGRRQFLNPSPLGSAKAWRFLPKTFFKGTPALVSPASRSVSGWLSEFFSA